MSCSQPTSFQLTKNAKAAKKCICIEQNNPDFGVDIPWRVDLGWLSGVHAFVIMCYRCCPLGFGTDFFYHFLSNLFPLQITVVFDSSQLFEFWLRIWARQHVEISSE
jgi:hypothetical protein